jgi:hypothetical protein
LELAAGGVMALSLTIKPSFIIKAGVAVVCSIGRRWPFYFEERPLDTWILSFIRAIYNPTKFHWKKTIHVPDFFGDEMKKQAPVVEDTTTLTKPQRASRVAAYFQSISGSSAQPVAQEDYLQRALSITQMYDSVPAAQDVAPATRKVVEPIEKPSVTVHTSTQNSGGAKPKIEWNYHVTSVTPSQEHDVVLPNIVASKSCQQTPIEVRMMEKLPAVAPARQQERSCCSKE